MSLTGVLGYGFSEDEKLNKFIILFVNNENLIYPEKIENFNIKIEKIKSINSY